MLTNLDSIDFAYSEEDRKLFESEQYEHWDNIQKHYIKIRKRFKLEVHLPQTGTHKEWIRSRVDMHVAQSLMRLLYLVEEFCSASLAFNSVAAASLIKSMAEIPLHLGYIVWVLREHNDFEKIRIELGKIAFGNIDPKSGLTTSGKISNKDLYIKSDIVINKMFEDNSSERGIFESIYKDSNATGHHNYEGRMLTGIQNKDIWKAGDRKSLFLFFSNKVFQIFLHCDVILGMTTVLLKAIDHYLDQLPINFE
jgi:hypothetical protein